MESTSNISPISSVAQLVAREHVVPRVYETDDGKHKVVNTHFETLLYNRNGYLQTITKHFLQAMIQQTFGIQD